MLSTSAILCEGCHNFFDDVLFVSICQQDQTGRDDVTRVPLLGGRRVTDVDSRKFSCLGDGAVENRRKFRNYSASKLKKSGA